MSSRFMAEEFRDLVKKLDEIYDQTEIGEAETKDDTVDQDITDVMTKEKEPVKLSGNINVKSLASDLGIDNVDAFQTAFNSLKQGKMPTNSAQIKELAVAFDKLLAADASTTSRVLSKLRQIHKS
jgi:hypothetical protein